MELFEKLCKTCGGDLFARDEQTYVCQNCKNEYPAEIAQKHIDRMQSLFDAVKLEAISNARRNLYDAVNAEYLSNTRIHECCMILKQYLPDDFRANFYETAIGNDGRQIARFIRDIDTVENADCMESVIRFLIRSLQSEYVGQTQDLIEKAFKNTNLTKYEAYSTELSDEAKKLDDCIYMTTYPRDVFVAYSGKDMKEVWELVEALEEQGLSCFVAARNLRHGKGAVENYEKALQEAMDNCSSFVLVSTPNSRHAGCDALKKEIPYIKQKDIEAAPPEHRNDYARLPHGYKKHRVEYRLRESARPVAADKIVAEFFDGYERVYSPDEVAERVLNANAEAAKEIEEATPKKTPKNDSRQRSEAKKAEAELKKQQEEASKNAAVSQIKEASVYSTVTFGSYFQSNLDTKEPIEWIVLKKECGLAFLLSKYVLFPHEYSDFDYRFPYCASRVDCVGRDQQRKLLPTAYGYSYPDVMGHKWEISTLRKYLNRDFLEAAFTEQEQQLIFTKRKITEYQYAAEGEIKKYHEEIGEKVFVPNMDELKPLIHIFRMRLLSAQPTAYAMHKNVAQKKNKAEWWVREPNLKVDFKGTSRYFKSESVEEVQYVGVRPAIWVKYE